MNIRAPQWIWGVMLPVFCMVSCAGAAEFDPQREITNPASAYFYKPSAQVRSGDNQPPNPVPGVLASAAVSALSRVVPGAGTAWSLANAMFSFLGGAKPKKTAWDQQFLAGLLIIENRAVVKHLRGDASALCIHHAEGFIESDTSHPVVYRAEVIRSSGSCFVFVSSAVLHYRDAQSGKVSEIMLFPNAVKSHERCLSRGVLRFADGSEHSLESIKAKKTDLLPLPAHLQPCAAVSLDQAERDPGIRDTRAAQACSSAVGPANQWSWVADDRHYQYYLAHGSFRPEDAYAFTVSLKGIVKKDTAQEVIAHKKRSSPGGQESRYDALAFVTAEVSIDCANRLSTALLTADCTSSGERIA
ncbi:MAG: hypothetical protein GX423_04700, partial [Nitrospiraceae bacterium]|nr:hypothetical protein [Nitrospiraceae bacterium]